MTDDELDGRLSGAGARWRTRNDEAAVDVDALAFTPDDGADRGAADTSDTTDVADTTDALGRAADLPGSEPLPLIPDAPARRHRRTRVWLAAAIGAAAAVAATVLAIELGGDSSGGPSGSDHPAAQGGTPLTETDWQLVATSKGGDAKGVNATLHLTDSGELSGNDGCNAFGGRVTIAGDGLTIGRVSHTMMGCLGANGTVGQAVDAVLSGGTVQYTLSGDTLTITKDGTGTLTYTAERQQATPAVTDPSAIAGPDWVLNTVQLGDNIAQPYSTASSAPAGAQLKFANGRLVGNDGCNSFTAKANLGSGTIAVTEFADTTANPCPSSSDWTLVLQGATHWQLAGDQLTIMDAHNGKLVLTEVPGISTAPSATATK